jgi:gamma-glutamyltranspeptidase/glutathione hydrolase
MEPAMNGIGGDLFVIYYEAKTGKTYGLNSSGWAPTGLTVEHIKSKGYTSMPQSGMYSVTVPGAVAGAGPGQPAAAFADQRRSDPGAGRVGERDPVGHPADHGGICLLLAQHPNSEDVPADGRAPQVGAIFQNPRSRSRFA